MRPVEHCLLGATIYITDYAKLCPGRDFEGRMSVEARVDPLCGGISTSNQNLFRTITEEHRTVQLFAAKWQVICKQFNSMDAGAVGDVALRTLQAKVQSLEPVWSLIFSADYPAAVEHMAALVMPPSRNCLATRYVWTPEEFNEGKIGDLVRLPLADLMRRTAFLAVIAGINKAEQTDKSIDDAFRGLAYWDDIVDGTDEMSETAFMNWFAAKGLNHMRWREPSCLPLPDDVTRFNPLTALEAVQALFVNSVQKLSSLKKSDFIESEDRLNLHDSDFKALANDSDESKDDVPTACDKLMQDTPIGWTEGHVSSFFRLFKENFGQLLSSENRSTLDMLLQCSTDKERWLALRQQQQL